MPPHGKFTSHRVAANKRAPMFQPTASGSAHEIKPKSCFCAAVICTKQTTTAHNRRARRSHVQVPRSTWVVFTLYPQSPHRRAQATRRHVMQPSAREHYDTHIIGRSLHQRKKPRPKRNDNDNTHERLPRKNCCPRPLPPNPTTQPRATLRARGCTDKAHVRAWGAASKTTQTA